MKNSTDFQEKTPIKKINGFLSPRQIETLELLCAGNSTKMAAEKMKISEYTVSKTLKIIRIRLKTSTTIESVARYMELKISDLLSR